MIKDIPELVKAEVISQETADRIRGYYQQRGGQSTNRLFIVFGLLGAILVGLGIILIIAHNWDELPRITKTILAFLPLIIGQVVCGFVLLKKQDSVAWREGGTSFLIFAVGASIALISQIYHFEGDLSSFLLTWILLCLPLIYVMESSTASLLCLIGITYFALRTNYWHFQYFEHYLFWLLFLTILPHYYLLYKHKSYSNFMAFHNWLIPLFLIITLGTVENKIDEFMFVAYCSLFGLFYLIGELAFFRNQNLRSNGFKTLGFFGTVILLLFLSFDWFWEGMRVLELTFQEVISAPEFIGSLILTLLASGLLIQQLKNKPLKEIKSITPVFILFIIIFIIGLFTSVAVLLINLLVFAIGIFTIRDGAKQDDLGLLNIGLFIITALVTCRFFDRDLSFIIRGGLFLSVGIGFFLTNFWMLKKRKLNDK